MLNFLAMPMPVSGEQLGIQLTELVDVFVSLFQSAFSLITGNWLLLAGVALPLIAGLIFSIVSYFRRSN